MSWGPLIFGHADPETVEAVARRPRDGTSFGAPTEREVELAAEIVDAVPSRRDGAVRLVGHRGDDERDPARARRTRRDRILKFAGCYHGHADALLAEAGSGVATLGIPSTRRRAGRGRPPTRSSARTTTWTRRPRPSRSYGEGSPRHRRAGRRQHGRRPAGARLPRGAARALRRVRRAARLRRGDHRLPRRPRRRAGALRRAARPDDPRQDRRRRAAARRVRRPRPTSWSELAPDGRRLPGGHALRKPARDGRRASRCCVGCATTAVYEELERRGARLEAGLRRARHVQRVGAMSTLFIGRRSCRTTTSRSDTERYAALFRHLLERGVYLAPSQFEAMFVSLAHGDEEIDRTVEPSRFFAG